MTPNVMPRAAAVLIIAAVAFVHGQAFAAPVRSQPAAGSTQATVPARVSIEFAEPQARSASIEVVDPCGARVDAGGTSVAGNRISVELDATASGRYVVRYAGISDAAGEPTRGSYGFRVRGVEGCAPEDVPERGRAGRGIWDLPKGDFAIALGIAALIGALGGLVYAAILGPKA